MSYDLSRKISQPSTNHIIDLRSDTVTKPSIEMRKIMADAEVGDDVYGEDPSINKLEKMLSEMLGKESGILMTSGTQSNLCAVLTHCARGEEVIIGDKYHIFIDEAAGASVLGGVAMAPIKTGEDNEMLPENIEMVKNEINDPGIPEKMMRLTGLNTDQNGKVAYTSESSHTSHKVRNQKVHYVKDALKTPEILGEDSGDLLVVGWGSSRGAIK